MKNLGCMEQYDVIFWIKGYMRLTVEVRKGLRWLETVSGTFQDSVQFDGSL